MAAFVFPDDPAFDPATRAVGIAHKKALDLLGLVRTDLASEFVAARMMSVAFSGTSDRKSFAIMWCGS